MSDFNYSIEDLNDTSSIVRKTNENFYANVPNNEPLKTSYSENGDASRTLTQRDLQSVLAGDALYRSPTFALQLANQSTQSSINGIIASVGGPDANGIKIQDPNSSDPNATLVGAAAGATIIAKSSLGKGYASVGSKDYIKQLEANLQNNSQSSEHLDTATSGQYDPTKAGQSQVRVYTARQDISQEEIDIFDEKVKELKSKKIITAGSVPFKATAFTAIDEGIKLTATAPDQRSNFNKFEIDSSFGIEKANGKDIYPCASLIEFLLQINEYITLRGNFDLSRGAMIKSGGEIQNGASLNDHTTGRGIDCAYIGEKNSEPSYLGNEKIEVNKAAMHTLLKALSAIDESLHPDLIVFDDRLKEEFGIVSGGDDFSDPAVNRIIQKSYQNLIKIDFAADTGHRNHIHIAFSPQRAGTYLDYVEGQTPSSWSDGSISGSSGASLVEVDELFESLGRGKNNALSDKDALYRALIDFGKFKPETAALLMMIPERESSFYPSAFNACLKTGDYSVGMWQLNYYSGSNQKFLEDLIDVNVKVNGKITTKKQKLYKLLFKDHEALNITGKDSAVQKMKEVYEQNGGSFDSSYQCTVQVSHAAKLLADPVLFTPIVQVDLIRKFLVGYPGDWKFFPWGEYAGEHPTYGWIHGLKFNTAVDFYLRNNPGKTKENLVKHCKTFIPFMTRKNSKDNYNAWLEGQVFPS